MSSHVVVDDVRDVVDVQSSGGDVGCDEDVGLVLPEVGHDLLPLGLGHVAVDGLHLVVQVGEPLVEDVDHLLRLAEDDGLGLVDVQDPAQGPGLVPPPDRDVVLLGQIQDDLVLGHGDLLGVVHVVERELLHVLLHGRGEQHRVPLLGHGLEDVLDVLDESHVQHPVGLVEDHGGDLCEVEDSPVDHVPDAPWGSCDYVAALLQLLDLSLDAGAAVDGQAHVSGVLRELGELPGDLVGQLPGGDEDDCGRDLPPGLDGPEDDGSVRAGLPGTGLGLAEHVDALESERDGVDLNRGGLLPSHVIHGLCDILRDADVCEF